MAVTVIWAAGAVLGESPVWSAETGRLTWLDIRRQALFVYEPATDKRQRWSLPVRTTCLIADEGDVFLAATDDGLVTVRLTERGPVLSAPLVPAPFDPARIRFNDGKRAPDGAAWFGTMDDSERSDLGRWYRFTPDRALLEEADSGYRITNGPAFDAVRGVMYATDSHRRTIYVAAGWDVAALQHKQTFRRFRADEGAPDGMAVAGEGLLWVAFWDGGCIRALDPRDGATALQVDLPAGRPTSCALGGAGGQTLFVTTASVGLDRPGEADGALLAVDLAAVDRAASTRP